MRKRLASDLDRTALITNPQRECLASSRGAKGRSRIIRQGRRVLCNVFCVGVLILLSCVVLSPVQAQSDEPATHTVERGETLSEIAKQYGVTTTELMQLNGIDDADAIYSGQVLRLPLDLTLRRDENDASAVGEPVLPAASHTVKRGETLSEIAKQLGVSQSALMALNGITDPDAIYAGQILEIPPAALTDAAPTAAPTDTPTPDTPAAPAPEPEIDETPVATEDEDAVADEDAETEDGAASDADDENLPADDGGADDDGADDGAADDETGTETIAPDPPLSLLALISTLNPTYTVRTNDTLGRIALRTGVDADALRQINNLDDESTPALSVGQVLILPATQQEISAQPESTDVIHVVEPGDSLSVIAKANGISLAQLMAANGISNPDSIVIGQRLRIPPPENSSAIESTAPQVGPARRGFYYYTVGVGDTLLQLASEFDSTVLAILEYNSLPDEETVYAGLELRIPYGPAEIPLERPRTPSSGTSFLVSLSRQQCWVFRGDRVLHSWTCSTGYGQYTTRLGTFAVQTRLELAKSGAYQLDMPYWLGIYDVGEFENGIHGLPVRWDTGKKIWTHLIGQPATFGCAMLADEEAAELFALSYLGMPVHIVN